MIQLTQEPYDGTVGTALVLALLADLNLRYGEPDTAEEQAASDAAYLAQVVAAEVAPPHGTFVVAWVDGEPVGCGALRPSGLDGVAEIKRMYTAPGHRGRGVGAAVLARLEAVAADLGYRALRLETGTPQPEAIRLYETRGWAPTETFGYYADHPDTVCLAKRLTP